ncbi:MAG: tetratricopeptide repeat protein [Lentisphaerae bacterium]|nr:tetratricopeptide repeat protein [Lentisphaerota bacterium]
MQLSAKTGTQILAVGGGKGGVGKSFVAAGLATAIAEAGHGATLVDLDLGGANLHTLFGLKITDRGIGDFIFAPRSNDLADYATETGIRNLQLISGNGFIPGIANLAYQQKVRVLKAIGRLRSEYVVLDLGAGTHYNVIDFFSMTESGIVVTMAEPTAILNAYEFLKNVLFRMFALRFKRRPDVLKTIEACRVSRHEGEDASIASLIQSVALVDGTAAETLRELCGRFRPRLVLNMSRSPNLTLEQSLRDICATYLGVELIYLGAVPLDNVVQKCLMRMKPVAMEFPESAPAVALRAIARKCMADRWMDTARADGLTEEEGLDAASAASRESAVSGIKPFIAGHKDIELSSLLASFMTEYATQLTGKTPPPTAENGGEAVPSPAAHAVAEGQHPPTFDLPEWLPLDLRVEAKNKTPSFIPVEPLPAVPSAPPEATTFWDRLVGRRPVAPAKTAADIIRAIPDSDNVELAIERTSLASPCTEEAGRAWMETGMKLVDYNHQFCAYRAFLKARACLPGDPGAINNCAAGILLIGRIRPAIEWLSEGLKKAPGNSALLFNFGLAQFSSGNYPAAVEWLDKVQGPNGRSTDAAVLRACGLCYLKRYPEARALFQSLLQKDETVLSVRFNLGLCFFYEQDYAKAQDLFSSVLDAAPEDNEALMARAVSRWHVKRDSGAFDDLGRAIKQQPANLSCRALRGVLSYMAGRYDTAIADIEVITRLLPANRKYQALLAAIRANIHPEGQP